MWRGRESSPGSGPPSLAFPTEVSGAVSGAWCVRYSGGAAPASHRFPWLPSAVRLWREVIADRDEEHDWPVRVILRVMLEAADDPT